MQLLHLTWWRRDTTFTASCSGGWRMSEQLQPSLLLVITEQFEQRKEEKQVENMKCVGALHFGRSEGCKGASGGGTDGGAGWRKKQEEKDVGAGKVVENEEVVKMGQEVQMRLDKTAEGGCIGGIGGHRCGMGGVEEKMEGRSFLPS